MVNQKELQHLAAEESLYYGAMAKTELAMLYAPNLKPHIARRRLMKWLKKNEALLDELTKRGYTERLQQLTTAQVRLIIAYLGEP